MASSRDVTSPLPPFADWPIQAHDPAFGFAWYAQPAAFVSQAHVRVGDETAVRVVQGWIDVVLAEREADIRAAGGLLVFHDWRLVERYTTEARVLYLQRMRARPKNYLRHSVTCVKGHPLLRMAVEAGNLVAAMTARAKVELAADPGLALARQGVQRPPPGSRFSLAGP